MARILVTYGTKHGSTAEIATRIGERLTAAGVDTDGTIAIDYGVKGIPEKIFVDADGVVSRKFVGPIDIDTLRTTLDGLLEGVDPSS